ncbi:MAG TPA: glycosyltransferase family 2 protein [Tepidisphaeraceae bacterium]|nr:glycosyltransferase family 2 protein [Tepidisphaeraceae bacterium]
MDIPPGNNIGIIAIGRNEGERLRRCLASAVGRGMPVVYVDSASTDGSPLLAREIGCEVVDLDMSLPFSAARARNEGFSRLMRIAPRADYIQFVDGDCEIVAGWIDAAKLTLDSRPDVAVVCGRRRERFPERSIYNGLADIEWNTTVGEVKSCGGDAMMRVAAFQQVEGFNSSIVAGEEPELCQRFRAAGWKILRIDAEMTLHDSAMLHFRQWWKRSIRTGYGALDVATRFGGQGLFMKHLKSARRWAVTWLWTAIGVVVLALLNACLLAGDFRAGRGVLWVSLKFLLAAAALILMILPLQMARTAWRIRRRARSWPDAAAYGTLTFVGMWASMIGQRQYLRDRAAGRLARMIDYKAAPSKISTEAPSPLA